MSVSLRCKRDFAVFMLLGIVGLLMNVHINNVAEKRSATSVMHNKPQDTAQNQDHS